MKIFGEEARKGEDNLWVALGRNRRGRFLVLTEERGDRTWRIVIPEEKEAEGWWKMMVT